MKSRRSRGSVFGRGVPAGIVALALFAIGGIAPAPARAQSGHIDFSADELDVGGCELGTSASSFWYVVNPSATSSVAVFVQGTDGPFTTPNKGASAVIKPGHYVWGNVGFAPTAVGQAKGTLTVVTSDSANSLLILPLRGTGVNGDDLPDLSGRWQEPNGGMGFIIGHDNRQAVQNRGGRAHVFAERLHDSGPHQEIQHLRGQFDGQHCLGWWISDILKDLTPELIEGGFGFVQDGNDPDTVHLIIDDGGKDLVNTYLTRRSPFAGLWHVWNQEKSQILGDMLFYRITPEKARQLLPEFGPESGWIVEPIPTTGISWYLGEYSWINGGRMLGYTRNTWDYSQPGLDLIGRYKENGGTMDGAIRIDAKGTDPRDFYGWYQPDSGGYYVWGATYLGPARP